MCQSSNANEAYLLSSQVETDFLTTPLFSNAKIDFFDYAILDMLKHTIFSYMFLQEWGQRPRAVGVIERAEAASNGREELKKMSNKVNPIITHFRA
jgi:hypothetical protein